MGSGFDGVSGGAAMRSGVESELGVEIEGEREGREFEGRWDF